MFDKVPLYKYVLVLKTANFIERCTRPVAILSAETFTLLLNFSKELAFVNLVKFLYHQQQTFLLKSPLHNILLDDTLHDNYQEEWLYRLKD